MLSNNHSKQKTIVAISMVIALSACGGGGGGNDAAPSPPSTPNTPDTPNTLIKFSDGDSYTYSSTGAYFNAPPSYPTEPSTLYYTYTIKNPSTDLSYDRIYTSSPPTAPIINRVNKNNQIDSHRDKFTNCEYTNEKEKPGLFPQIGETWSVNYQRTCTHPNSRSVSEHSSAGQVVQRESYTTEAGTFSTFKTEITSKQVQSSSTTINKRTCWFDEISAQTVACQGHSKSTSTTNPQLNYERKYTISLIGINTKNHPIKKNRVERFIGYWDIKIGSLDKEKCLISIEATGDASGTCSRDGYTFDMAGTVTPEGFIALVNRGGSFGLAGNFADPTTVSGTWKTSWENGTWTGLPTNSP
ncbi:hypothetical protein [Acidovorax sp.]|uniref:hypothetical protein n=1 Tax=Acidovorax sp. TaxID=1872122 RepID=UPI002623EFE9|nr:hypothetical protein [Acidovorax sp.]